MKLKIAFDYDRMAQKEVGVELDKPEHIARNIVRSHFNKLDYNDRQRWINNNLEEDCVKQISEEELNEE